MLEKVAKSSLLFDFYGNLLTERKRQVMILYHEENLSLSEIAEELGVSRAAVYDSLRSAEKALETYEEKLGFLKLYLKREEKLRLAAELTLQISEFLDQSELGFHKREANFQDRSELKKLTLELREVLGSIE